MEEYIASDYILDSFEIEDIDVESLLFQTGYLTIKRIDEYDAGDREYIFELS